MIRRDDNYVYCLWKKLSNMFKALRNWVEVGGRMMFYRNLRNF